MIKVEHVHKSYEQNGKSIVAIKDVSLDIQKGEIFGIIGFSGAGKSSLIRCMNFLEKPTSGQVTINGVNLAELSDSELRQIRRKMGMIFQHFNLLSSCTVYENIAMPLELVKTPKKMIAEKVEELLHLVGLQDKAKAYPAQLSGGQKQRVAIARALANDPEILLCDEATSALDPQTTDSILDLLLSINKRYGITIVLITHEMNVIKKICDRVAVMEKGEIIEQGTVLEIFSKAKHPTTRNFVHSVLDIRLPEPIMHHLRTGHQHGKLIRLAFIGETVTEPILYSLTTQFAVTTNILYGNISQIKDSTFGNLIVHIYGKDLERGIKFLKTQGVEVEILEHLG